MVVAQWLWLGGHRTGGSGSAGLVFTQAKKKVPCWLRSVLYGMAEKVMEVQ